MLLLLSMHELTGECLYICILFIYTDVQFNGVYPCLGAMLSQQLLYSTGFLAPCAGLRVLPVCLCSAIQEDGRQHT